MVIALNYISTFVSENHDLSTSDIFLNKLKVNIKPLKNRKSIP